MNLSAGATCAYTLTSGAAPCTACSSRSASWRVYRAPSAARGGDDHAAGLADGHGEGRQEARIPAQGRGRADPCGGCRAVCSFAFGRRRHWGKRNIGAAPMQEGKALRHVHSANAPSARCGEQRPSAAHVRSHLAPSRRILRAAERRRMSCLERLSTGPHGGRPADVALPQLPSDRSRIAARHGRQHRVAADHRI
ncbi:hypothetical protein K437DRAFT_78161 [Tilletiaria anomala UBC 951]|uniref:Uncharacterized protein n=1 Tax=Tilletiaria anomala (strain ATCC 24038 / CBS 436.72 / UBC 951) TaxID=1037660 RepID=A0A066VA54_TILAU|nr:uncharacterized protein K437DRAFT_78161 [Tilletiaria anomala UBC 951]KDN35455.1 hypothetical protein K437DRAFT_78161 [Tilletiaria anomala UBC 951]